MKNCIRDTDRSNDFALLWYLPSHSFEIIAFLLSLRVIVYQEFNPSTAILAYLLDCQNSYFIKISPTIFIKNPGKIGCKVRHLKKVFRP